MPATRPPDKRSLRQLPVADSKFSSVCDAGVARRSGEELPLIQHLPDAGRFSRWRAFADSRKLRRPIGPAGRPLPDVSKPLNTQSFPSTDCGHMEVADKPRDVFSSCLMRSLRPSEASPKHDPLDREQPLFDRQVRIMASYRELSSCDYEQFFWCR
jgi:hypothetical protein